MLMPGTVFKEIFYERFDLYNSKTQGIVEDLHPFLQSQLMPDPNLQSVLMTKFANPPEKIIPQKVCDVIFLYFLALRTNNFLNYFHFLIPNQKRFSYQLHFREGLFFFQGYYLTLFSLYDRLTPSNFIERPNKEIHHETQRFSDFFVPAFFNFFIRRRSDGKRRQSP